MENYPKDVCYDMEASGFIELAQIDSIPEQLAVVKVITDNHSNPFRHQSINELEMSMRKKKEHSYNISCRLHGTGSSYCRLNKTNHTTLVVEDH